MKELLERVESLINWVNNDDNIFKSIFFEGTVIDANQFPFAAYALWVRQILKEDNITVDTLKAFRYPSTIEFKVEQEVLLQKLTQFLERVWEKIRGTDLEYNINNTFKINQFCIQIAEKLAVELSKRTENSQKITKYKLLMPTIKYDYVAAFGLPLEDLGALRYFILNDDGNQIIPVEQAFIELEKRGGLAYYEQESPKELCDKPKNLSKTEKSKLLSQSEGNRKLHDALLQFRATTEALEMYTLSFGAAVEKLSTGLLNASDVGTGREGLAGAEAYQTILYFLKYYDDLDSEDRKLFNSFTAASNTISSNIDGIVRIFRGGATTHNRYCIWNLAKELKSIFENNRHMFKTFPKQKAATPKELVEANKEAYEALEDARLLLQKEQENSKHIMNGSFSADKSCGFFPDIEQKTGCEMLAMLCQHLKENIGVEAYLNKAQPLLLYVMESESRFKIFEQYLTIDDFCALMLKFVANSTCPINRLRVLSEKRDLFTPFRQGDFDSLFAHGDVFYECGSSKFLWRIIKLIRPAQLVRLFEAQHVFEQFLRLVIEYDEKFEYLRSFLDAIPKIKLINLLSGTNKGVYDRISSNRDLTEIFLAKLSVSEFMKIFNDIMIHEYSKTLMNFSKQYFSFLAEFVGRNEDEFIVYAKNNLGDFIYFISICAANGIQVNFDKFTNLIDSLVKDEDEAASMIRERFLGKSNGIRELFKLLHVLPKQSRFKSALLKTVASTKLIVEKREDLKEYFDYKDDFPAGTRINAWNNFDKLAIIAELNQRRKTLGEERFSELARPIVQNLTEYDIKGMEKALEQNPMEPAGEMEAFEFLLSHLSLSKTSSKEHSLPAPMLFSSGSSFKSVDEKVIKEANYTQYLKHANLTPLKPECLDLFLIEIQTVFNETESALDFHMGYPSEYTVEKLYNQVIRAQNLIHIFSHFVDKTENLSTQTKLGGAYTFSEPVSIETEVAFKQLYETLMSISKKAISNNLHKNKIAKLTEQWSEITLKMQDKVKNGMALSATHAETVVSKMGLG